MTCPYLVVLQNTRCSVSDTGSEHYGGYKFCTKRTPTQALALTAPLADLLRVDVLFPKPCRSRHLQRWSVPSCMLTTYEGRSLSTR